MITIHKVEEFVISQLFRPYAPDFIKYDMCSEKFKDMQKRIETRLRRNPEYIMALLENKPETKKRVFDRLRKFGSVKFYKYLDKDAPILQWIAKELREGTENNEIPSNLT